MIFNHALVFPFRRRAASTVEVDTKEPGDRPVLGLIGRHAAQITTSVVDVNPPFQAANVCFDCYTAQRRPRMDGAFKPVVISQGDETKGASAVKM